MYLRNVSYIIGSHDDDDVFDNTREIFPIGSEDVHVKILSTIFRLADVLHTDHSRIPHIRVADDDSTEDDKTRFRKLVKGWGVRMMAVEALGKLGTRGDLEVIKDKLNDTGWSVRTMAVEALGKLGTRGDLEVIKDMLDDPNPVVRTAASNYISEFGNENDLGDIVTMYANGEVVNPESLKCIITLDEKFYSTFKKPARESGNA